MISSQEATGRVFCHADKKIRERPIAPDGAWFENFDGKEVQMPRGERVPRSVVFHQKISKTAKKSINFRKVIYDGKFSDLAVMSVAPGAELGEEAHKNTDEILFVVKGKGEVSLRGRKERIRRHDAIFVASEKTTI